MRQYILLIVFSVVLLGCKKSKKQTDTVVKKPVMSIAVTHTISNKLDKSSQEKIKNWKEHKNLAKFLDRFKHITPNGALNNAVELKDLTKQLKDSVHIESLKTPAFKARVNVLENEVLRLVDMTYIPAITPKEVNYQVDKIVLLYESLNAKIKALTDLEKLDENLNIKNFLTLKPSELKKQKKRPVPKKN